MTDDVKSVSRRSFLRTGAVGGGVAAAGGLAAPAVLAQSPLVIKMQTSWPASDIFMDMARQYVERVQAMSGGRLQVDLLPAGAVVGAFQVLDGVNDGVLDAAHTVPVYWYGKHKGASLFGTGPVFGGSATTMLAWFYQGGGKDFYRELTQDITRAQRRAASSASRCRRSRSAGSRSRSTAVADIQGFKYRTVGLAADLMQQMGMSVAQLPGGEIVPAMERGVIDAYEFNNPTSDLRFGSPDVAKNYYLSAPTTRPASSFEFLFNQRLLRRSRARPAGDPAVRRRGGLHRKPRVCALNNYSADLQELQNEHGVTVHRTPQDDPGGAARGLGRADPDARGGRVHQARARQPARLGRARHLLRADERGRPRRSPTTTTSRASSRI